MWWAIRERKPGFERKNLIHAVGITGDNYDQIVALILHNLEQNFDRLLTVVALVLWPVEVIGLVDEQDTTHGLFQDLFRFRRGMADILADKIVPRHGDKVSFAHVAELMENLGHAQRDRGLAGPGIAGEAHMQSRRLGRHPQALAHPINEQQGRNLPDTCLDRREPDEFPVELIEHFGDMGIGQFPPQIYIFREVRGGRIDHRVSRSHFQNLTAKRTATAGLSGDVFFAFYTPGGRRLSPASAGLSGENQT